MGCSVRHHVAQLRSQIKWGQTRLIFTYLSFIVYDPITVRVQSTLRSPRKSKRLRFRRTRPRSPTRLSEPQAFRPTFARSNPALPLRQRPL